MQHCLKHASEMSTHILSWQQNDFNLQQRHITPLKRLIIFRSFESFTLSSFYFSCQFHGRHKCLCQNKDVCCKFPLGKIKNVFLLVVHTKSLLLILKICCILKLLWLCPFLKDFKQMGCESIYSPFFFKNLLLFWNISFFSFFFYMLLSSPREQMEPEFVFVSNLYLLYLYSMETVSARFNRYKISQWAAGDPNRCVNVHVNGSLQPSLWFREPGCDGLSFTG